MLRHLGPFSANHIDQILGDFNHVAVTTKSTAAAIATIHDHGRDAANAVSTHQGLGDEEVLAYVKAQYADDAEFRPMDEYRSEQAKRFGED